MILRAVTFSAKRPLLVLVATLLVALGGVMAERHLSHDAVPDLSDPQIVLIAEWMGHPAPEVQHDVTDALTRELASVPGATTVRGASMAGMAYVDVVFREANALARGRAHILSRVGQLKSRLPPGVLVRVGPEASSTGWIFQYAILPPERQHAMPLAENAHMGSAKVLAPLRAFQDDVLRPALATIPGVAEVATLGGHQEEVLVATTSDQLRAQRLAFSDVVAGTRAALAAKTPATLESLAKTRLSPPSGADAPAPTLGSVAGITKAPAMPQAIVDVDGAAQAVGGIVIARRGADVNAVTAEVRRVLDRVRGRLPAGAKLGVVYDRSELARGVERTLLKAVGEEVLVVALVVLLFLVHVRSALVPMLTLPLVVLLTFGAMWLFRVPATVMSLGGVAIALGLAVDAELVALEACHRQLETAGRGSQGDDRRRHLITASGGFAPAILTSLLIAACAFVPVFAFGGETGRLLWPLALTKTVVILAAALVAVTTAPALRDRLLRGRVVAELDNPLTRGLVRAYRPFVAFALGRPWFTLTTAALAALSCFPIVTRLGSEFLPRIDEGDLLYMPTTSPGSSAEEAALALTRQDLDIAARPEVALVFGKLGRAETATDPASYAMAETTIRLKPRATWPERYHARWYSSFAPDALRPLLGRIWPEWGPRTTAELVTELDRATRFPGWTNAWTAPVRARMDMMATGVRTPVGVRVVASSPTRLDALGTAIAEVLEREPGTDSATYESLGGELHLDFEPDHAALLRYDVDPELVRATVEVLTSDGELGVLDGKRVRLSLDAPWKPKRPEDVLRDATVRAGADHRGQPVPLALLGRPVFESLPAVLRAERGELSAYVHVNVKSGTDLRGYVERARAHVDHALTLGSAKLGPDEHFEWTGQYPLLVAGERRLLVIAPLVMLSMLGLLLLQFRSLAKALIVLASVPFALVGSFWTLFLLDYQLSAPVWVGLLSVVGLAMQTGVLMIVYIDDAYLKRLKEGKMRGPADLLEAHAEGTIRRLRPKLMTITTMGACLLPLLWSEGSGAEIMRRIAAPMLGGLVTSAFLTLEVLPVLYTLWRLRELRVHGAVPSLELDGTGTAQARAEL